MKEVLTKSFWQGVKKTFDDARDGVPEKEDKQIPAPVSKKEEPIPDSPRPPQPTE
jgi:hypothetical protein